MNVHWKIQGPLGKLYKQQTSHTTKEVTVGGHGERAQLASLAADSLPLKRLCTVSFSHTPTSSPLVNSSSSKYMQNSATSHPLCQYHHGLGHQTLFPDLGPSLLTSLFCFYVFLPLVCFRHSNQNEPIKQKSGHINFCL